MNNAFNGQITEVSEGMPDATFSVEEGAGPGGKPKLTAHITILKAGRSINPRRYRSEALQQAARDHIFDKARMFVDHQDVSPLKRSMREMVSAIESTSYNAEKDTLEGEVVFFDPKFHEFASRARDYMGNSIKALCHGQRVREGSEVIEDIDSFIKGHSVDWVIYPAAGGQINAMESEEEGDDVDWTTLTAEELKEKNPTLFAAIQASGSKPATEGDENKPLTQADVARIASEAVQQYNRDTQAAADKQQAIMAKVKEAVDKSGLPSLTRARLVSQLSTMSEFSEAVVTKAIEDAKAELKAIGGPKIVGEGTTDDGAKKGTPAAGNISATEAVMDAFHMEKEGDDKKK